MNRRASAIRGNGVPIEFTKPEPLVFVHNDLHMGNIILGNDGRVWLLDWECAGFYPQFFEYTAMFHQCEEHDLYRAPMSFRRCIPFIANPYFGRYRWLAGCSP